MTCGLITRRYFKVLYWTISTKILVRRSLSQPIWYLKSRYLKSRYFSHSINPAERRVLELEGPILN